MKISVSKILPFLVFYLLWIARIALIVLCIRLIQLILFFYVSLLNKIENEISKKKKKHNEKLRLN